MECEKIMQKKVLQKKIVMII